MLKNVYQLNEIELPNDNENLNSFIFFFDVLAVSSAWYSIVAAITAVLYRVTISGNVTFFQVEGAHCSTLHFKLLNSSFKLVSFFRRSLALITLVTIDGLV